MAETAAPTDRLEARLSAVLGLSCWYVSAGGAAGSSFSLAFGGKVPRGEPLKNPTVPDDFRDFDGEQNLYVWCSWRLDGPAGPIASSDCSPDEIARALVVLGGARVTVVESWPPAWDLRVRFDALTLNVFCDHVGSSPSFDGNWELCGSGGLLAVGTGGSVVFDD